MKERYQDIDEKSDELKDWTETHARGKDFLDRLEMAWIYHDSALEGTVYNQQELSAALTTTGLSVPEASLIPIVLEIRNHKAACDFIREDAATTGKKQAPVSMVLIKRIHDLLSGNTPEAQAARASIERRERTEKELAREREKQGLRKDMPLHRTYFHEIAQPAKIPPMLEKLIEYTNGNEFKESHPIKQAATIQHMFMQIFPFTENSGKVGRLLTNLMLFRHGYLPCIIPSIDRQRYYEALRGNQAGFRGLVMDAMENSLDNGLKYFKDLSRKYRAI